MTQETEENDYTTFSSAEIEGDREIIVAPKWIGNIRCFWPNKNGIPRITIGPNWGFTIVLGVLVCGTFYITTSGLINMYKRNAAWHWLIIGAFLIISGISSFFLTLLGDPGIPPKVYWYHARPHIEPRLEEKKQQRPRSLQGVQGSLYGRNPRALLSLQRVHRQSRPSLRLL